ncbi:MAG: segregation/condensation protein A, partial [Polyangiaceae bacterium]
MTDAQKPKSPSLAKAKGEAPPAAEETPESTVTSPLLAFQFGEFDGPLDLLLHLCQKHELDILDIPIGFVTQKYLEYLGLMQSLELDVAAEYLVMAATLAHIKSKMLLPAPPPGQEDDLLEEEEDPREMLIRRLLEYQKYKQAGAELAARGVTGRDVFTRGVQIEEATPQGLAPLQEVPLFALLEAFQAVLSRAKIEISHDIVQDRITITDRIHELTELFTTKKQVSFTELFAGTTSKFELVITFLALLEMSRLKLTRLTQTGPLAPIYIAVREEGVEAAPPEVMAEVHAQEVEEQERVAALADEDGDDDEDDDEDEDEDEDEDGEDGEPEDDVAPDDEKKNDDETPEE